MRRRYRLLCCGLSALIAACSHAPRQELAAAELQQSWSDAPANAVAPADAAWWRTFHDPALDQLIALAQTRNLDLRLAEARVREARALRAGAVASLWPQLDAAADFSRGRSTQNAGATRSDASLGASVSWELDLFGRLRSEQRAALAELQASEADRDAVRLTLLAEVARSYLEYRLYRTQHELTVKTAQAQESTLRITQARFKQGMGNRLDVERAISLLANTRAQVPQAQELAEAAFHRLVLLTAGTPDGLAALLPAGAQALPDSDLQSVLLTPTQVLSQRPDVRAAERRLLAASESRGAAEALRYPQLNLSALIGLESDDVGELLAHGTRSWSFGAGLLAPLFDFGRIRAAIDVADARQQQAWLGYERSVRTALQEAQTALVRYTQGKLRQAELSTSVAAARNAATLARRQYTAGALSLLDVLDAERSLYEAELAWSQATAEVSLRLVSLYQTMGVVPPLPPVSIALQ